MGMEKKTNTGRNVTEEVHNWKIKRRLIQQCNGTCHLIPSQRRMQNQRRVKKKKNFREWFTTTREWFTIKNQEV